MWDPSHVKFNFPFSNFPSEGHLYQTNFTPIYWSNNTIINWNKGSSILYTPKFVRRTSSHQCTSSGWGRSSCFGDELKHIYLGHFYFPLPLPRVFSALFSAPKFSPPIYLPTSSSPKPKFIFSPTGLASFFSSPSSKLRGELRNVETQGSLKLPLSGKCLSLKVSSLPSPPFLFFQYFFPFEENSDNCYCLFLFLTLLWRGCHCLLLLIVWEEEDDDIVVIFFPLL